MLYKDHARFMYANIQYTAFIHTSYSVNLKIKSILNSLKSVAT